MCFLRNASNYCNVVTDTYPLKYQLTNHLEVSYMNFATQKWISKKVSFDIALAHLITNLMGLDPVDLITELAYIGNKVHVAGYEKQSLEIDLELIERYAPNSKEVSEIQSIHGGILFTRAALQVINSVLIYDVDSSSLSIIIGAYNPKIKGFVPNNGLYVPATKLPMTGIFLLANRVAEEIRSRSLNNPEVTYDVFNYYTLIISDRISALGGRLIHLYNTPFFNDTLLKELGMSVDETAKYFLYLYTHAISKNGVINSHFSNIKDDHDRSNIIKLLEVLSIDIKSHPVTFYQLDEKLKSFLSFNELCLEKPILRNGNTYFFIDLDLFTNVMADFPFYYLLSKFSSDEKRLNQLRNEFNGQDKALEKYIKIIANKTGTIWGECKYSPKKRKGHEGHEYCDLMHIIDENKRVFVEAKGKRSTIKHRRGLIGSLDEFINGSTAARYGALQLVENIKRYRKYEGYNGEAYAIVLFYGRFPEATSFDDLVQKKIMDTSDYQEYVNDQRNHKIIYLSCINAELFFSAIKQGISIKDLLKRLEGLPPSKIMREIKTIINERELKSSFVPLFEKEIQDLITTTKFLLRD